jgi:predicted nucleic acid-binding protein
VTGHRQWNDFHWVALARAHGLKLATFDRGVAAFFPEDVDLIPAG